MDWKNYLKDVPTEVLQKELEERQEKEYDNITKEMDPQSLEIINKIDEALELFGEYTFGDKGPHEVMNIYSIKNKLNDKSVKEISKILSQVLDNYSSISGNDERWAYDTVNSLIGEFDSRKDFDEFFEYDDRFEY